MCRRILRREQTPPLWVVLGVVLVSLLATSVAALAGSDEVPDNDGSTVIVSGGAGPDDECLGGGTGSGDGDPDDPIIDVPMAHRVAVKLVLLFTIYLP